MSNSAAKLRSIVLFTRNLQETQDFLTDVLSLKVIHHQPQQFTELQCGAQTKFMLKQAPTMAHASTGFSPLLNLEVENIDQVTKRAQEEYKAEMDGEIEEDEYMKYAVLRTQCGISLCLHQTIQIDATEIEFNEFVKDKGVSSEENTANMDPKSQELRRLFESIKI